ncbi:phosphorylase family protein [Coleofasciculus sp. E1-EBD-02]|uniref:phosphorylase family protein n=1 Tax=Coleofasciculus sp. E1-EBD-02 TaxID=3068481 RepID=UPI0032F54925
MTSIQISGLREDLETIELLSTEIFQENEISAKTKISEFRADSIEVDQILPVLTVTFSGVSVLIGVINRVLIIKGKNNKPVNQKEIPIYIKIQASNGKELELKVYGSMTNTEIKKCVDGVQEFVDDFLLANDGMSLLPSEKYINQANINKINLLLIDLIERLTDIRKIRRLPPVKNERNTIYKFLFDKVNFNEIITLPEEKFYLKFDEVKSCKNIFYVLERENILCFHEVLHDRRVIDMQNIFVGYKIEKLSLFKEMTGIPEFIFSESQEKSIVDQDKIEEIIKFNQMSISNDSIEKLLPLLRPYLRDENERRAYLIRALGMDTPVLNRLVLNTPVDSFITSMVTELVDFGEISPGQPALCALLEVIREDVGVNNKAKIDKLLQQLREELTETPVAQESVSSKQDAQNLQCAVILTAIPIEYRAVRAHLTNLEEEIHPEGTIYERGNFLSNGQSWQIGIVEIGAGNAEAAVETKRAIDYFKPTVVLFVGVAGGIKDVVLGDVVAATKVYGYESGKVVEETFQPRPNTSLVSYRLEQRAKAEVRKEEWLNRIGESMPTPKPRAFTGAIAAGDKVVASTTSDLYQLLRTNYGDALAVEMESHGFLKAVRANPEINALIIRGISDLIDGKSNADAAGSQEKAAQHASAFAFEILAKLLGDGNQ